VLDVAPQRAAAPSLLDRLLPLGISAAEGGEIVARVLAALELHDGPLNVYASPISLYALLEEQQPRAKKAAPAGATATPQPSAADGPRDEIERKLAELWQGLLGVERVGIHDDFFELGGHSLIAVRLFSRLRKLYQVELSLAVLFRAPTIATCADLLREELGVALEPKRADAAASAPPRPRLHAYSPLVAIQTGKSAPFFCVHGAGGNVLNFRDIASRLGKEQTFYGLQARGVSGGEPQTRVEDMAGAYIDAIRGVQPRGPYLLGGYSGGGVIAYEMGQRLIAAGERVSVLALLDTFHPNTQPRAPTWQQRFDDMFEQGASYLTQAAQAKLQRHYECLSHELKVCFFQRQNLPMPLELREAIVTRAFVRAAARYTPKRYPGPVTLYRAQLMEHCYLHVGPKLGWDQLIPRLEVVQVPGNHATLVAEPNVHVLTQNLKRLLAGAGSARREASFEAESISP
jgi:thioesterase domain-containing protein/acyl carrier protein